MANKKQIYRLESCPICDSSDIRLQTDVYINTPYAIIECNGCHLRTKKFLDLNRDGSNLFEAIDYWNSRKGKKLDQSVCSNCKWLLGSGAKCNCCTRSFHDNYTPKEIDEDEGVGAYS